MLELEITITGKTTGDLELALEEVQRSISGGNTSGMNGNEDGKFSFDISEREENDTLTHNQEINQARNRSVQLF